MINTVTLLVKYIHHRNQLTINIKCIYCNYAKQSFMICDRLTVKSIWLTDILTLLVTSVYSRLLALEGENKI